MAGAAARRVPADDVTLRAWFAAGAVAVGASSQLCPPAAMAAEDWDTIASTARAFLAAAASARP